MKKSSVPHPTVIFLCFNNRENENEKYIGRISLENEKSWIGVLCAIHKDLNGYHDWCRVRRSLKHNNSDW